MLSANAIPQVPTQGLVAYDPFDSNANDEIGNGNNKTASRGVSLGTEVIGNPNSADNIDVRGVMAIPGIHFSVFYNCKGSR